MNEIPEHILELAVVWLTVEVIVTELNDEAFERLSGTLAPTKKQVLGFVLSQEDVSLDTFELGSLFPWNFWDFTFIEKIDHYGEDGEEIISAAGSVEAQVVCA